MHGTVAQVRSGGEAENTDGKAKERDIAVRLGNHSEQAMAHKSLTEDHSKTSR